MRQDLTIEIEEAPLVTSLPHQDHDQVVIHAMEGVGDIPNRFYTSLAIEFPKASVPTLIGRLESAAGLERQGYVFPANLSGLARANSPMAVGKWLAEMLSKVYALADARNKELDEAHAN